MLNYALVRPAVHQSDLAALTPYLLALMLRNVASDGFGLALSSSLISMLR